MSHVVRTRFAPSPTGFMHVGGVRTALFAWLVARQANGNFLLRIEDTDRSRHVEDSEKHIINSLKSLGLDYDEGPDIGGDYGPYRQSERLNIYKQWAQKLIDKGRAYADPTEEVELNKLRQEAKNAKKPFLYREHRPTSTPEWDSKTPLRFKSEPKNYKWHDEVLGNLETGPEAIDDFIIIKSDGFPTYNFAHIVDDYLMKITYAIRSTEFLASVPKFLNLYEALEIEPPILATPPVVLGPDGKKKLSKRDGAKDILEYIHQGYLPEALVNFMASLGWNDGTEQEIYSVNELIKKFDLSRVQKSGARFDEKRLEWMNGYHIRQLPVDELYSEVKNFWPESAKTYPESYKKKVLALVQERLKYLAELPNLTSFFFEDLPINLKLIDDNNQLSKLDRSTQKELLEKTNEQLEDSNFSVDDLTQKLNNLLRITNQKPAILFSLIRIATTWAPASPGLAETLATLGKDKTLERIQKAMEVLYQQ